MTANKHHELRSWKHLFEPMLAGGKRHDLRKNDRNYQVGDTIALQEYDVTDGSYTGREMRMEITYITGRDEGCSPCAVSSVVLDPGYVILSVKRID